MKNYFFLFLAFVAVQKMGAQGCSDAGVCTFASESAFDTVPAKNSVTIGYVYGKGLADVFYHSGIVDFSHRKSDRFSWGARVTYNQAHGSFGVNGKPGDAYLIGNFSPASKHKLNWSFVGAVKAPLSTANQKINGYSLPMDYQSSLGTVDLLFNAIAGVGSWKFDAAFQLPVVQSNRNSYFDEYSAAVDFPTTNFFRRKADVLVRGGYSWQNKKQKFTLDPSVMAIYHVANDEYVDIFGKTQEIANSAGLTINVFLASHIKLTERSSIEIAAAAPLVVREVRPDGLTRAFISSISYQFMF